VLNKKHEGIIVIKKNNISGDNELLNLGSITVGEILAAFNEFQNIIKNKLKKNSEIFSQLPLKIVIKRVSNNKVVDLIGIRRIEMNKEGTCIWLVCFANVSDSIFIHNKSIVKLKLTTKPVNEVSNSFNFFKKIHDDKFNNSSRVFFDLPVKVVIMSGEEGNDERVVDTLDIATVLMDDVGSGIFCHSLINDIEMIKNNAGLKKLLDESEMQYTELMKKLSHKF
tara:strand:- start:175 stop:846 length:672 start_codon:yes stop_codon:yes gene_type:complete